MPFPNLNGRPPKYNDQMAEKLALHVGYGCPRYLAAQVEGICLDTFNAWMATRPQFSALITAAEGRARSELLALMRKSARNGNTKAQMWLAERLMPKDFGPPTRRIELDAQITLDAPLEDLPNATIGELIADSGTRAALPAASESDGGNGAAQEDMAS